MKTNIIIYGHCQLRTLQFMLMANKEFNRKFTTFAPNRQQVTSDELTNLVKNADIFIYNNVKSEDKPFEFSTDYLCGIHSGLKIICTKFWFRQFSLGGYPEILPYRLLPFYLFYKNYSEEKTFNILKNISPDSSEYTDEIGNIHSKALQWMEQLMLIDIKNLEKRHREDEVKNVLNFHSANISTIDFIKENSRKQELCYTFNHPTWAYFKNLYKEMCKYLNIFPQEVGMECVPEGKFAKWCNGNPSERACLKFITHKYPEFKGREVESNEPRFSMEWINKQFSLYAQKREEIINVYKNDLINMYLPLDS